MSGTAGIWHQIGRQLRQPAGAAGRVCGHAMALLNARPNRVAIEALEIAPTDTVLELGFGPGRALRTLTALASRGAIFGIDRSAVMLSQASRHNRRAIRDGRVQLRQGSFEQLPWTANSVDKILAVNVAYFFDPDATAVREARRVLRPGGRMALYATDKRAMAGWKFAGTATHQLYDRDDLMSLVLRGGFTEAEISLSSIPLPLGIPGLLLVARKQWL